MLILLYVNDCYTADILQLYSYCQSNGCSRCARAPTPVVISQLELLLVISTLYIGGDNAVAIIHSLEIVTKFDLQYLQDCFTPSIVG